MTKDLFEHNYEGMCHMHEIILRTMDQIVKFDNVPEQDLHNYIGYVNAVLQFLQDHQKGKNLVVFPPLKDVISFDQLIHEHEEMDYRIMKIKQLLEPTDLKEFPYKELHDAIHLMRAPLVSHFNAEEELFNPANNIKTLVKVEVMTKLVEDRQKYHKNGDGTISLPIIRFHLEGEKGDIFWNSLLPGFVRRVIFPLLWRKHREFWKYAYAPPN